MEKKGRKMNQARNLAKKNKPNEHVVNNLLLLIHCVTLYHLHLAEKYPS